MMKLLAFLAPLFVACAGCGKNYNGTFKGTESFTQGGQSLSATMTATITEKDGKISGTWSSSAGGSGTVTGTIADGSINPFTVEDQGTCKGDYVGSAKLDSSNNSLEGTASGTAGTCGEIKASFTLIRQ